MKNVVVGNWKQYVHTEEEALSLVRAVKQGAKGEVICCVPAPFIPTVTRAAGKSLKIGAQDVSVDAEGAHTGEISSHALKSAGAQYVLIGHSERRARGESDEVVRVKMTRAIEAKLMPLLCIGEKERDAAGNHFAAIETQIRLALGAVGKKAPHMIIAYEPVWAIGKKAEEAMKPAELQETVIFIRKVLASLFGRKAALSTPVLYGGSVDSSNVSDLMKEGGVQGFLVGRASVDVKEFKAILKEVFA